MSSYLVVFIVMSFSFISLPSIVSAAESESQLKAAIIGKLTRFVVWPSSSSKYFIIGVVDEAIKQELVKLYANKMIHKLPVMIKKVDMIEQFENIQLVYIENISASQLHVLGEIAKQKHFLTIGSSRGFADRGGMIRMYRVDQKISLKINLKNVKQAGLSVHSSLLRIAALVKG